MGSAITEFYAWRKGRGRQREPVALGTCRKSGHRTCRASENSMLNTERPNGTSPAMPRKGVSAGVTP